MAVSIKHPFTLAKPDGPDATVVQPSDWNDNHDITLAAGNILGRPLGAPLAQAVELPLAFDVSLQAMQPPAGTTAQRPGAPAVGSMRYNTSLGAPEVFTSLGWVSYAVLNTLTATADQLNALTTTGIGSNTATSITNADTQTIGGFFFMASGATGNPLAQRAALHHIPADTTTSAAQIVYGLTTGEMRFRIETGGVWGAWLQMPLAEANGVLPALARGVWRNVAVDASNAPLVQSGTVPSWVNQLVVRFREISHTQTNAGFFVQALVGGVAVTSGYSPRSTRQGAAGGGSWSAGASITNGAATSLLSGAAYLTGEMVFTREEGTNIWQYTGWGGYDGTAGVSFTSGSIALAGPLNGIRILPTVGSFDPTGGGFVSFEGRA